MSQQLFTSGRIMATPRTLALIDNGIDLVPYLVRHLKGDWVDLSSEDIEENEFSLKHDLRIFSAYNIPTERIWIITEADRSATTVLLPSEY